MNQAGLRVVTVVVGRDSFGLPENEHPGLIFMDYRLNSNLTSPQVAGLLRQTFAQVPIVLLSSELNTTRDDNPGRCIHSQIRPRTAGAVCATVL
jgi:hypothetical protein